MRTQCSISSGKTSMWSALRCGGLRRSLVGAVEGSENALEIAVEVLQPQSHSASDWKGPFAEDGLKPLLLFTPPVAVAAHVA
jgi:hypothetical protein